MARRKSLPGTCAICGAELKKVSAAKHVAGCIAATPGVTEYVLVKAVGAGVGVGDVDYWLLAAVPVEASLKDLDQFLRKTWLECCGHMSAFRDGRLEVPMSRKIGQVAVSGVKLIHEYDFGSTTELAVTFEAKVTAGKLAGRSKVVLLARNNKPNLACDACGKPAEFINAEEAYDGCSLYCSKCIESDERECEDEFILPVVNSPRCGVCAYEG